MSIQLPKEKIELNNFIGGKWEKGGGSLHKVICPYNGQDIGQFHESSEVDLKKAVQEGARAAEGWGTLPIKERTQILFRFREVLLEQKELIANSVAIESGKTPTEGLAGLMKGVEVLEYALSLQNLHEGGKMTVSRGVSCEYRREPLGVVLGITPFNFPAMVPMWMIPNALALGNTFIWKPSDKTPLTSYYIAEALKSAGLPDGVFNVVQGGRRAVETLIDQPEIEGIAFVGSSSVASSIYQRGCHLGKRVLALGGAKNHIILMPDADFAVSSQGIADSFTGCAGQRCMAASTLLAVGETQKFIDEIVRKAKEVSLGEKMGALISKESQERLNKAIDQAKKEGAKILLDGRQSSIPDDYKNGFWLGPTVLDHVKPGTQAATEELFGPVISIIRCENLGEALRIERSSPYGNAASVFTSNGGIAERVCSVAKAGMVGVNVGVPVPREPFSFGGFFHSKFGHGDITGASSVQFWTRSKKVTVKWATQSDQNWMS